jgi:hypothetical protein
MALVEDENYSCSDVVQVIELVNMGKRVATAGEDPAMWADRYRSAAATE